MYDYIFFNESKEIYSLMPAAVNRQQIFFDERLRCSNVKIFYELIDTCDLNDYYFLESIQVL